MTDDLLSNVVLIAAGEVGVREEGGRNRGPRVDQYILALGLYPAGGYPWCACFVWWCFAQAVEKLGIAHNPCVRTASALNMFRGAPPFWKFTDPSRVRPGNVVVWDHGAGKGHTGIVEGIDLATSVALTIEGNTNAAGHREGDGVYRKSRPLGDPQLTGFVDYGLAT